MHALPLGLLLLSSVAQLGHSYTWPSPQYDALEGLLYEGRRPDGSSLAFLVHPCRKRVATLSSVGAEWLRFAFHDMATHNIEDGTGGMDGSLVYELDRPENAGLGFNLTSSDFELFPNKYVSRADVISIGTIQAVASCGGPLIPFKGGRVDSWVPGGLGTPEPQHDINLLTESFRKQGFNKEEMIKLVACGHTMGAVRSEVFPQLVPPGPNPNIPVLADFDTTMEFDNKVVTEYLDGTSQNVLVTTSNATLASDLRVFSSDGNNTVRALADAATFQNECKDVLGRMLDVVPKGVTLTEEITLLPAKVTTAQITIEKDKLVFKSNLRLTQALNTNPSNSRTVTMFWCDRNGGNKDCKGQTKSSVAVKRVPESPNLSPVTQKMGFYFVNYNFVVPLEAAQSISKFWFEVNEGDGSAPTVYNNDGKNYPIDQDSVIFVPTLSTVDSISNGSYTKVYTNREGEAFYRSYNLVVGVKSDVNPSRVWVEGYDSAVRNFQYAVQGTVDFQPDSERAAVAGYKFYKGVFESSGLQLTLDIHAEANGKTFTNDFVTTSPLDNTVVQDPGTVATDKKPSAGAESWRLGATGAGWTLPSVVLASLVGLVFAL